MNTSFWPWVALLPALAHGVAAVMSHQGGRDAAWRRAEWAAALAMLAGAVSLVVLGLARWAVAPGAAPVPALAAHGLRLDPAGAVLMPLVGFIAWAIVRYCHRAMDGEPQERTAVRMLSAALAAVSLVLVADHLLLLALSWLATSAAVHRLLRFYADRPAAQVAAHKKWLSSLASGASLALAVGLLVAAYDTWSLHALLARAEAQGLTPLAQAGVLLLVLSALLKCAQMPLHGWLLQVMEAPTPVSALLHAGVVNLGGLVLIRCAPLLAQSPAALGLLALVATTTVVLATLALGTRISIKLALAWSTVAQMGFMLLQVALGQPAMALLHIVAHSLYKAHAFLSAGGVVQRQQARRLAPMVVPKAGPWSVAAVLLPAAVVGTGVATGALSTPAAWLAGAVLGVSMVPLAAAGRVVGAVALVAVWFALHALASAWLAPGGLAVPAALVVAVAVALAGLFGWQALIVLRPAAPWVQRLHPIAYGGFFVDDHVSRWLLRRWPVPGAGPAAGTAGVPANPHATPSAQPEANPCANPQANPQAEAQATAQVTAQATAHAARSLRPTAPMRPHESRS